MVSKNRSFAQFVASVSTTDHSVNIPAVLYGGLTQYIGFLSDDCDSFSG